MSTVSCKKRRVEDDDEGHLHVPNTNDALSTWFNVLTLLRNMLQHFAVQRANADIRFESYPTADHRCSSITSPGFRETIAPLPEDDCLCVDLKASIPLSREEAHEMERRLKKIHMTLMSVCSDVSSATYRRPNIFHDDIYIVEFHFCGGAN